jgi:hypothetical protein
MDLRGLPIQRQPKGHRPQRQTRKGLQLFGMEANSGEQYMCFLLFR